MTKYNFLGDNFTVYENVDDPKVELNLPLMDNSLDISEWASELSENGTPIVKSNIENIPEIIVNNTEEVPMTPLNNSASKQNPNLSTKKKQAMEFFQSKGLSAHQAAGIVGNLIQESNLNTTIKGDGGKAFGIAQWHPDRQKGLKTLAQLKGKDISDYETQLEYVWQELNTSYKGALDKLLKSRNADEATTVFMRHFEKPNEKYANLTQRIKNSNLLLS